MKLIALVFGLLGVLSATNSHAEPQAQFDTSWSFQLYYEDGKVVNSTSTTDLGKIKMHAGSTWECVKNAIRRSEDGKALLGGFTCRNSHDEWVDITAICHTDREDHDVIAVGVGDSHGWVRIRSACATTRRSTDKQI